MQTYTVTFTLTDDNLAVFMREVSPHLGTMNIRYVGGHLDDAPGTTVNTTHKTDPKRPRTVNKVIRKRGSKVNDTIIGVLQRGEASSKEIREALRAANLSPSSISMGLLILQRENLIKRAGDGKYALVEPKSDEAEAAPPAEAAE